MNWLAHLYLSEPDAAFRVGNLLPDLTGVNQLATLPEMFQGGIRQHRRIDGFTDTHAMVRQSIQRVPPPLRRFGGILTDLFYDHFLSVDWPQYSATPLPAFTREVYDSFEQFRSSLPPEVNMRLELMRVHDWLGSYQTIPGLTRTLERIALRFSRPVNLAGAMPVLEQHYDLFHSDFQIFFPELRSHLAGNTVG